MRLQLKPGYRYEPNCVVSDGRSVVIHSPESKTVTIMLGFAVSQQHNVADDVSWLKTAHLAFEAAGWDSPWNNVATSEELTAAAEGEGPVAPVTPAPRPCAVDRLEAAGYKLQAHTGTPTFVKPNSRIQVVVGRVGDAYRCSTAGDISKPGDPCPGLNAALESLLSKPVGAVTVAQILGVAP